jgi:hypothetical protein
MEALEHRRSAEVTSVAEIKAEIGSMDKLLRGNGVDGLVTKVTTLIQRQEFLVKEIEEIKRNYNKIIWWVIGGLASCVGTLIMAFIVGRLSNK